MTKSLGTGSEYIKKKLSVVTTFRRIIKSKTKLLKIDTIQIDSREFGPLKLMPFLYGTKVGSLFP